LNPSKPQGTTRRWAGLLISSAAAAGIYVFMEWVFFATKPSFMTGLGVWEKLNVLMIAPVPALAGLWVIVGIFWIAARLINRESVHRLFLSTARTGPALLLAATAFLLLDNFTYTLFGFGLQSLRGAWRYLYFGFFLFLAAYAYTICVRFENRLLVKKRMAVSGMITLILTMAGGAVLFLETDFSVLNLASPMEKILRDEKRPNILLITTDGLSADNLSIYGYNRQTTPFLSEYCQGRSLFCENAFPNAANTSGSIASMLTGKPTTQIRIYYPPEILSGKDAYEHLPGILRRYGYFNIDISIRQFADAYDLNMRNSFDMANDRKRSYARIQTWMAAFLGQNANYFLEQTYERFRNRLLYSMGLTQFITTYDEVTQRNMAGELNDGPRMHMLLSAITEPRTQPFFAHVHLLGTHGGFFYPKNTVFSKEQTQTDMWMIDFYDDAILDFDGYMKQIVTTLAKHGKLESTIIVIGSDHGMGYQSGLRIPLIFLFPGGAHAGTIQANTQNLDIAPTLLDYLKIPKPRWMTGRSLLQPDLDRYYPIFSTEVNQSRVKTWVWMVDESKNHPPFYSLGNVAATICNKTFRLFVDKPEFKVSIVSGHTDPCPENQIPDEKKARQILFDHLEQYGYDITSLKAWENSLEKGN
jgi:hypothetical protein